MRAPLRIGLILDSLTVPEWIAETIEQIAQIRDVRFALVIIPAPHSPFPERGREGERLFDWYMQFERRRVGSSLAHVTERDISSFLTDVPRLSVVPSLKRFTDVVGEEQVAFVRGFELDVILRFGMRIVRGALLDSARYGVWSYHHGDNDRYRGGPPGFWEISDGQPVSGVTLQVLTDTLDGGLIIDKSFIRTHDTSPICNRENLYWSGISLMRDAVQQLVEQRPDRDAFFAGLVPSAASYDRGILKKPTTRQTVKFLLEQGRRYFQERFIAEHGTEQWSVGVCKGSIDDVLNAKMLESSWYLPGPTHFVADPFPVIRDGQLYIFVEEFVYSQRKGKISVIRYDGAEGFSAPQEVLQAQHHLSYPYVFEHDGKLLMVPESEQAQRVTLYECVKFPNCWRERSLLLNNFNGIDTSLFYHEGLWWLFTTDGSYGNSDNHLQLYYSEKVDGPFQPHRKRRVKSTLYGSRMAGRVYEHNGRIYRPGQNCVHRYGGSVVVHEVLELSPESYQERVLAEIKNGVTGRFQDAFHTINQCSSYTLIDGSRLIRR